MVLITIFMNFSSSIYWQEIKPRKFKDIKMFWQAYTTPAVRNVISLPLEFGSDEYVFERFASSIRDNRRLFIYLT